MGYGGIWSKLAFAERTRRLIKHIVATEVCK